jgi:2',3'-cyclic-nucleotide 2'-phosphodiesterase/3'-nucleotidase
MTSSTGPSDGAGTETDLTILGSTDTHGFVINWDYYRDAEYDDGAGNHVGLAKLATLVERVRAERGDRPTLVLDAGDTIQGTELASYFAREEPITVTGQTHPVARAMNIIGYDAVTLGNHEFNYGLSLLEHWIGQLGFPALAANAVDPDTGEPAFPPYLIRRFSVPGGPPLRVGVLGLTNPGTAVWDRAVVAGRLRFEDMVATAARWVPVIRDAGADVVVVCAHGGDTGTSTCGPEVPAENPTADIAAQVPGIDAILFGHVHAEVPQRFVTNQVTGGRVLLCEPYCWGQRLARMDLALAVIDGRWRVTSARSLLLNSNTVPESPAVVEAVRDQHARAVAHVNQIVARATVELSAAQAHYRDTPILGLVNHVQAEAVRAALTGTAHAGLPVLSVTAPFRRQAVIPAGDVRLRDVAGLYVFDNALEAVLLTGTEVAAYLEHAARFFRLAPPDAPVDPATLAEPGMPAHNFDVLAGLHYDIDISRPAGRRIVGLRHSGTDTPVTDVDTFVVAVNSYRRSGGGNFPGLLRQPVYAGQREIRQLLMEWARQRGTIDPAEFHRPGWRLVRAGTPVF